MKNYSEKRMIPFTDLTIKKPQRYLKKIASLLETGKFILGDEVLKFEELFASYIGAKYAIGVGSGTDGILIALRALGIKQNDEVIVPAFTFVASATPICMLGGKPIFVDVRSDLPLIDEEQIEKAITSKTRAIIVVHLYGYPCHMEKIKKIAKKYKLFIIEDASQSHGAIYKKKKVGSIGDIGVFSFYPTKNLGAFGDGAAIVTSNKSLRDKIRLLRDHGQKKKYSHSILGYNSRLDALQAAVLSLKLQLLDKENKRKRKIVTLYNQKLKKLPLTVFNPHTQSTIEPVYYVYVIQTNVRNALAKYLQRKKIGNLIHYPTALPDEKIFAYQATAHAFSNARRYAKTVLSIPFFSATTSSQIDVVVETIKEFFSQQKYAKRSK